MTNAEKYFFSDFTRKNYRQILKLAKSKYVFKFFNDDLSTDKFILWRHDVDYSPQSALALARIEKEEGVYSTFFLLLHSEFYNLLERENTDCFKEILKYGHKLALHFDCSFYNVNSINQLEDRLQFESSFLSNIFESEINVFSFHNPFEFALSCEAESYAGLINTYSSTFKKNIGYCSDSNGYWRYERLEDVIRTEKHNKLQALTHPEWWQEEVMSPKQRMLRCVQGRAEKNIQQYDQFLKKYQRENIDW